MLKKINDIESAPFLIPAAWFVMVLLVGPWGNFPLNDDWSYAWTVRRLCQHNELDLLPWSAPSLLFQVWYGTLLCKIFGFSFTLLRLSTLVLAPVGLVGFFFFVRRLACPPSIAWLATLVLGGSPLFFSLSFTFMTEIPILVALSWASLFYLKAIQEERWLPLIGASLLCGISILIRQNGIFLAAAASVTILIYGGMGSTRRFPRATLALLVPGIVFAAYHVWLFRWYGAPAGAAIRLREIADLSLLDAADIAFRMLLYLGLLLCPLAVPLFRSRDRAFVRRSLLVGMVLAGTASFLYWDRRELMYYLPNIIHGHGLGALTLRDALFLGMDVPFGFGPVCAVPLTIVAIASAATLCAAWLRPVARSHPPENIFPLLSLLLFAAGSLLQSGFYFDRYVLPALPFAIAATVAIYSSPRIPALGVVLAVALAVYSVAGTHDYLAWNRARHEGLGMLLEEGRSVREIDGGVEFNGWHLAPELRTWPSIEDARVGQSPTLKSWWWVVDDRFVASFNPLPGYREKWTIAWASWLGPRRQKLYILERSDSPSGAPAGPS